MANKFLVRYMILRLKTASMLTIPAEHRYYVLDLGL